MWDVMSLIRAVRMSELLSFGKHPLILSCDGSLYSPWRADFLAFTHGICSHSCQRTRQKFLFYPVRFRFSSHFRILRGVLILWCPELEMKRACVLQCEGCVWMIASEVSSLFSPAPVNICRWHLVHSESSSVCLLTVRCCLIILFKNTRLYKYYYFIFYFLFLFKGFSANSQMDLVAQN